MGQGPQDLLTSIVEAQDEKGWLKVYTKDVGIENIADINLDILRKEGLVEIKQEDSRTPQQSV